MDGSKRKLIEQLVEQLTKRGVNPRQEVRTAQGVADIVTDSAVYEVVALLTADTLRAATDRVVACRDALDPKLKAVVYGGNSGADPTAAMVEAKARGVTVNFWKDGESPGLN